MSPILLLALGPHARAHQPHDPADVLAVSPAFGTDGTVFVTRYPDQNWRSLELAASRDGGTRYEYAFRGIDNASVFVGAALSPEFGTDGVGIVTTAGDGAWITVDGGLSWSSSMPDTPLGHAAVAHDGTVPVLFVAEADGPVWRSVDLGATWEPTSTPSNPTALAAYGADVVAIGGSWVYRSSDAGASFAAEDLIVTLHDVAVGPDVVVVGTGAGLGVSEAGGPFELSPAFSEPIYTVGVSPTYDVDGTIYAAKKLFGVYVSEDRGQTFTRYATGLSISDQSEWHYFSFGFSGDYATDGTAFVATFEGLALTRDHGRTWIEADTRTPGMINAIGLSPDYATDQTLLVASLDAGMWVSTDGGDSFTISNDDLRLSSIYDVQLVHGADGAVDAVLAQNGWMSWGEPPFDGWELRPLPPGIDYTSRVALSPTYATDGLGVVGTRYYGLFRTEDFGATWTQVFDQGTAISGLAWGPDGTTILAGTNAGRLLRSADAGATFELVTGVETGFEPVWIESDASGFLVGTGVGLYTSVDGLDYVAEPALDTVIHQIATTPDGTRYAVLRGGGLYRSDAGGPWTEIATALTAFGCPHEFGVSPQFATDHTLFASIDERLFRSTDRGDTWTEIGMTRIRYEEDAQALRPHLDLLQRRVEAEGASVSKVALVPEGGTVALEFVGTGVVFVGSTREDLGDFELAVDGTVVGSGSATGAEQGQVELFRVDGLPWGVHDVVVTATVGDLAFDAFDVLREVETPTTTTPPTTTPPTDGTTTDTGEPTTPGTTTDDGGGKRDDDDGGGCGCASTGRGAPIAALALLALAARRRRR